MIENDHLTGVLRTTVCDWRFNNLPNLEQTITQQETVTHCLLFTLQPLYQHSLSLHKSSQPIASRVYQRLLYLLINQIADHGFWIFNWLKTITWLWRWLPHRLSKRQSQTTVLLRTSVTQMIIFNQGTLWDLKQSGLSINRVLMGFCFWFVLFFFTVRIMRFSWGEIDQESQLEQIVGKAGTEIGWGKTNLFIIMGETWQQHDQTFKVMNFSQTLFVLPSALMHWIRKSKYLVLSICAYRWFAFVVQLSRLCHWDHNFFFCRQTKVLAAYMEEVAKIQWWNKLLVLHDGH